MTARFRREKRDPLARAVERHVPPGLRSRAMRAMSARAGQGHFALQRCLECRAVTYPPRDICPHCWSELAWEDQARGAVVLSETTIRVTTDLYFRDHLPWRMGKVALDAGPVALAHLHAGLKAGDRAEMKLVLDKGGNAALFAAPAAGDPAMPADVQGREFVVPVKDRTVLVSDGRNAVGRALVEALTAAGAGCVVAGLPPPARPADAKGEQFPAPMVRSVPLDLTDSRSVSECFARLGGPLDIVVNTARFVRPGGISRSANLIDQKKAFDIGALGFSRLAQAAAPLLVRRPCGAFVDILSVHGLAPDAGFAGLSASEAARYSLLQSFRHEMRAAGVRVSAIFAGPTDDEDHQSVPLPKVAPARLAGELIKLLEAGQEQRCVGDFAVDAMDRWLDDPALYSREKNV
ncbi:MAG: SDR family NAD(P)-dependent oxidoreductase [Pseudolabrys sp.]